ncbi:hypothetical protein FQR65_LT11148 [Abscondita terminalis]|nr:hypothetical protein FQR65_LT11148 [Abscondita terminalis]
MDQVEPVGSINNFSSNLNLCNLQSYVEFLDLTGIEEQERNWILSSLYATNPNIKLPWSKEDLIEEHSTSLCYELKPQNYNNYSTDNQLIDNMQCEIQIPFKDSPVNGIENKPTSINNDHVQDVIIETHNYKLSPELTKNSVTPEIAHIPAKSWASLFNKNAPVSNADFQQQNYVDKTLVVPLKSDLNSVVNNVNILSLKEPFKSNMDDPNLYRMGEYLSTYNVDNRIISLQPRGLINRSNYCYINSILQAILACPPVYNLLCGLGENTTVSTEKKRITPTIDSMTKFVKEFHHLPAGLRVGRRLDKNQKKDHNVLINCDAPFEPFWFHKLLSGVRSDTFVVEGRQEDAEEFLCCLLNGLNDEMLEVCSNYLIHKNTGIGLFQLMKLISDDNFTVDDQSLSQEEDKEWQVMGPKNKGAITRRTEFCRTPISDIFGGSLRSRLHRTGDQSTDNIQPFFTLQLNIEKSNTVREALETLVCKNQLEGVTSSKTNKEVEAWQQVTLEELPLVLVLHLKCFDYKLDGCSKIMKALEFPIDLKIDAKMLSIKNNYAPKEKQYKLFAVVYHEGKEATKGHYITDAYHVGYASWLRYDDSSVKAIPEDHVLNPLGTRVPYLLFYRRSDSLSKSK